MFHVTGNTADLRRLKEKYLSSFFLTSAVAKAGHLIKPKATRASKMPDAFKLSKCDAALLLSLWNRCVSALKLWAMNHGYMSAKRMQHSWMCKYIQPPFSVNSLWFPPPRINMAISLESLNEPKNVINLEFTKPSVISWHVSGYKIYMLSPFAHARFVLHAHKCQKNPKRKQAAIMNGINRQKMAEAFQMPVCNNLHDGGPSSLNKTHSISCIKVFFYIQDAEYISENNLH